jgi:hypothetical protein
MFEYVSLMTAAVAQLEDNYTMVFYPAVFGVISTEGRASSVLLVFPWVEL